MNSWLRLRATAPSNGTHGDGGEGEGQLASRLPEFHDIGKETKIAMGISDALPES